MANMYRSIEIPKNKVLVTSLTVTSLPTKTSYVEGETLDTTGLVINAVGLNGFSGNVADYCHISPTTLSTAGTQTITAIYGNKVANFDVTVSELTLEITTPPTKTSYVSGDTLDLTGIAVIAYYGSTPVDVTSQCTFSPADGTVITSSGTITATFQGKTATISYSVIGSLEDTSWADIKAVGAAGNGSQYWSIGDTKTVTLNGAIGDCLTLANFVCKVFIVEFNYRNANGIYFQGFKTTDGVDIALCDSKYDGKIWGTSHPKTDTTKDFSVIHARKSDSISKGWKSYDLRYDILGGTETPPENYMSTDVNNGDGYDATISAITNPVPNTLMAALPSDLRNALALWTVWACSTSTGYEITDAITLLNYPEVTGKSVWTNEYYDGQRSTQMSYYSNGNSKIKYKHSDTSTACKYWLRTISSTTSHYALNASGEGELGDLSSVQAIAPAFRVA